MPTQPALSLDDLATNWLSRRMSGLAAMPGLNNDLGASQVEADPAAIKHMIFPPYSAGNETTWATLLNGRHIALQTSHVEIRCRKNYCAVWRKTTLDAASAAWRDRLIRATCSGCFLVAGFSAVVDQAWLAKQIRNRNHQTHPA